jgi:hypothetical protein
MISIAEYPIIRAGGKSLNPTQFEDPSERREIESCSNFRSQFKYSFSDVPCKAS